MNIKLSFHSIFPGGKNVVLTIGLVLLSVCWAKTQNIIQAEYFFDADPGPGNGIVISGIPNDDSISFSGSISTASLGVGFHFLAIRVKDANLLWSHFEKKGFYISPPPINMPDITGAEYFFDTDPGTGNGNPITVSPSGPNVGFTVLITPSLEGLHFLSIRVKDASGTWSLFDKRSFYVSPAPVAMPAIQTAEYFWDMDPGVGNGIPFSITTGDTITPSLMVPIDMDATLGQHFFTVRVKDVSGRWSLYAYDTVTVAISLPPDTTLNAQSGICTAIVNGIDPMVYNNMPYSYTLTGATTGNGSGSASGLAFNTGITTVTYTLDAFPTAFASFTVTIVDNQIPTITCPANLTVNSDQGICGAVVNYSVPFSDNCPGASLTQLSGLASGSTFPIGTTTNTFRITDASGNSSSCSFTITVADLEVPVLSCPANITVSTDPNSCGKTFSYTVTLSDNCPGATFVQAQGLASGSFFPKGATTNTFVATDANGNSSSCSFILTVVDTEIPGIVCPANITVNHQPGLCEAVVAYGTTTFSDNCPGVTLQQTSGLISGSSFPVGLTINTFIATDAAGNTNSCVQLVTVTDNEPPVISCPSSITIQNNAGVCGATVPYTVTFSDNCPGANMIQTSGLSSGSIFPVGMTTNSFIVTDSSGNSATCSFTITITDTEQPTISCPANITVNTDPGVCGAIVTFTVPISDNCPPTVQQTSGLASGSLFPVGVTANTFMVTDPSGNSASCSFNITVTDNQAPSVTCPPNITVNTNIGLCTSSGVSLGSPVTNDNCGISTVVNNGLSIYPLGNTSVTWTVTDVHGLVTTCIQNVTVVDNQNPVLTCPVNITTAADPGTCNKVVSYTATATDNCGISTIIFNPASGSTFNVGTTMVTVTATDVNGNTGTCTFSVTITETVPPTISCPADMYVNISSGCSTVVNYTVSFTDNCSGVTLTQTTGLPSGGTFPTGPTTNTFVATDAAGNTAACQFIIYVIPPGEIPNNNIDDDCDGLIDEVLLKAGINTTQPSAMLHVEQGDVLFGNSPVNLPGTQANPPASGAGTRMMWYPDKSAFRAGTVTGSHWDKDSIGNYSLAIGYNAKAIQPNTFALGTSSSAHGFNSFVLGNSLQTLGGFSFALGNNCTTMDTALFSSSIGSSNQTIGKFSSAIGRSNVTTGNYSSALGNLNQPTGEYALVLGYSSMASGSHAISMGVSTSASGLYSMAVGYGGIATGEYSIKMGLNGQASGYASLALGAATKASGKYSAVAGSENKANGYASFISGIFNDTLVAPQNSVTPQTPLFMVGNGNSTSARSNALVVRKDGYIGIGNVNPQFGMHVMNNDTNDGGWEQGVVIENNAPYATAGEAAISFRNATLAPGKQWTAGINQMASGLSFSYANAFAGSTTKLYIDTSGMVSIGNITPGFDLEVDGSAGKPGGGNWTATSDLRLKQSIRPYEDGVESLLKINPVAYHYNALSGYNPREEHIGVLAQEFQQVAPYMVRTSDKIMEDGSSGYLEVDASPTIYLLINAIQEQQLKIDALKDKITRLKSLLDEKAAEK